MEDYPKENPLSKKRAFILLPVGAAIAIGLTTKNLCVGMGVGFGLLILFGVFFEKKTQKIKSSLGAAVFQGKCDTEKAEQLHLS